jgi:hypothetical protein
MTVSLKHTFTSAKIDSADPTIVQPSNWNEEHVLTAAAGKVLGRDTSGNGVVQELPISVTSAGNVTIPNNFAVTGTTALTGTLGVTGTTTLTNLNATGTVGFTNALAVTSGGIGAATLPANNVLIGNGTSAITGVAPGTSGNVLVSNGTSWASTAFAGSEIVRVPRTSNTQIGVSNRSNLIDITSGTFSQTFVAAATLTSGWFCYIRNSGTGDITLDPNGAETIDGLTSYIMYPGEVRLVQCDGTALRTIVLSAFYSVFTGSGTFTKPPGYTAFTGLLWGGGGSGGSSSGSQGGGGGGACHIFSVNSAFLSASCTVTIASGGAGVASGNGNAGGDSSFDGKFSAFGGAGNLTTAGIVVGAGGGGALSAGLSAGSGGNPGGGTSAASGQGFGGAAGSSGAGSSSYAGGASGAGTTSNSVASVGGASVFGGGGGGSAGTLAGVGAAGGVSIYGGSGGASGTGGGVAGTAPGGGGGAAISGTSGAGARGELRIWGIV